MWTQCKFSYYFYNGRYLVCFRKRNVFSLTKISFPHMNRLFTVLGLSFHINNRKPKATQSSSGWGTRALGHVLWKTPWGQKCLRTAPTLYCISKVCENMQVLSRFIHLSCYWYLQWVVLPSSFPYHSHHFPT